MFLFNAKYSFSMSYIRLFYTVAEKDGYARF